MSFLAAVDDPQGFGCLVTDTRMPQGDGGFSDTMLKQTRLRNGFIGRTGASLRWVRLRGARLDELDEKIRDLHESGVRWARSREGRSSEAERSWKQALDEPRSEGVPDGVDRRYFAMFAAISMDAPGVHQFATAGRPEPAVVPPGSTAIFWPPGHEDAEDRILASARERAGSPTDLPWTIAIRALAALNHGASEVWPRVGPIVDVAVVDRNAGELRRGRAPAAELVEASDQELRRLIRVPTFADRVRRRLGAARWRARTRLETV